MRWLKVLIAGNEIAELESWRRVHKAHLKAVKDFGLGGATKVLENMDEYVKWETGVVDCDPKEPEVLAEEMNEHRLNKNNDLISRTEAIVRNDMAADQLRSSNSA